MLACSFPASQQQKREAASSKEEAAASKKRRRESWLMIDDVFQQQQAQGSARVWLRRRVDAGIVRNRVTSQEGCRGGEGPFWVFVVVIRCDQAIPVIILGV